MDLHQKITIARKEKGLTQEQLAEMTNISVRTIQRIEGGENVPRAFTLKAIATALDVPFEEWTAIPAPPASEKVYAGEEVHALQMICLSCFSYLVIPLVHFLIPAWLLKRSGIQRQEAKAFARQVIRRQIYWSIALSGLMLLTMLFNFISRSIFPQPFLLNYMWPLFIMFGWNAVQILLSARQIKAVNNPLITS
ncbi:helix-turn-helix domain-containing protein [Chitinophaga deserti]|uniref:helix-turn-helix domain-containing protein n=1 Tax=Chitinophaga deserti TaxID=2164099 RepID=UPI000D6AB582|nr:helix-turn-helix transcriptional regulator [Chitinophaga deserti]